MILTSTQKNQEILSTLVLLALFAIAFGYIEGCVAHYLRMIYYPRGFTINLVAIDLKTLLIEMIREFSTLVVLASAAMLTAGPKIRKAGVFVYLFAIWDLSYYGALYLFEAWPNSLLDWDVLFLIPVPWLAPVLAPVIISITGLAGAILLFNLYNRKGLIQIDRLTLILEAIALAIWLYTFLSVTNPPIYDWKLFCAGIAAAVLGIIRLLWRNTGASGKDSPLEKKPENEKSGY